MYELNLGPIIDFDLDTKKVMDSFLSIKHDATEFGAIVAHCKSIYARYYRKLSVKFVQRLTNKDVHDLVIMVIFLASFWILIDSPAEIEMLRFFLFF